MGSTIKADGILIESSTLPCVQEVARISPQLDGIGLVCNSTYGIIKHQPIGVFNGDVMTTQEYTKTISDSVIQSTKTGSVCRRTAYAMTLDSEHVLDCWHTRGYVSSANNACHNANSRVELWKVGGVLFLVLVANREIKFNEPILFTYGKTYIECNNNICYGVFCGDDCKFDAVCKRCPDGSLKIKTRYDVLRLPAPHKTIQEVEPVYKRCKFALSKSPFYAHSVIIMFFTETCTKYSWIIPTQ